jgi:hypothetical protein
VARSLKYESNVRIQKSACKELKFDVAYFIIWSIWISDLCEEAQALQRYHVTLYSMSYIVSIALTPDDRAQLRNSW